MNAGNELTLLLNADYKVIKAIPWYKAITLLYSYHPDGTPKVAVVEEYDRYIKCASAQIKVPAVVALTRFYNIFKYYKLRFSSPALYQRDDYRCSYCGEKFHPQDLTKDHVIPRTKFRKGLVEDQIRETSWENIVAACRPCNVKKGGRTPEEAGMKLLNKPYEPSFATLALSSTKAPEQWKPYIKV